MIMIMMMMIMMMMMMMMMMIIIIIIIMIMIIMMIMIIIIIIIIIKGYVVLLRAQGLGSETSKCASKSLDNRSFEMDLYMLGRSLIAGHCNKCHFLCCWKLLVTINAWFTCSLSQILIYMNSAISP